MSTSFTDWLEELLRLEGRRQSPLEDKELQGHLCEYAGELDEEVSELEKFEWSRLRNSRKRIAFQTGLTTVLAGGIIFQVRHWGMASWTVLGVLFLIFSGLACLTFVLQVTFLVLSWLGHEYRRSENAREMVRLYAESKKYYRDAEDEDGDPIEQSISVVRAEVAKRRVENVQQNQWANDARNERLDRSRLALMVCVFLSAVGLSLGEFGVGSSTAGPSTGHSQSSSDLQEEAMGKSDEDSERSERQQDSDGTRASEEASSDSPTDGSDGNSEDGNNPSSSVGESQEGNEGARHLPPGVEGLQGRVITGSDSGEDRAKKFKEEPEPDDGGASGSSNE